MLNKALLESASSWQKGKKPRAYSSHEPAELGKLAVATTEAVKRFQRITPLTRALSTAHRFKQLYT